MTVRVYQSTDASAPVLSGTAGALCTVLDAVLVNGYGSKTAAGWTIAFSGTSQRVYTMGSGGTGFSLYVNDAGPGSASYEEARVAGFQSPSGLGTGTGQFPSTSQMTSPSGALVIRKSTTNSSATRNWTIVADAHTFYLFTETGDNPSAQGGLQAYTFCFGDFFSYSPTDTSNCMIIGRNVENSNSGINEPFSTYGASNDTPATVSYGQYIASSWTRVGGSVPFGKFIDCSFMGVAASGQGTIQTPQASNQPIGHIDSTGIFPYPNQTDGALWLSPIRIVHSNAVRGYLKGIWAPLHDRPLNHNDTFTVSSGNLSGKSFVMQNILGWNNAYKPATGQVAIETSDTWS